MRIFWLLMVALPLNALAVDNMMVNSEIPEIRFQKQPTIGMSFKPGGEPGVVVSLPEGGNIIIPGYRVRVEDMAFIVGIACEENLSDDCSAYPYSDDYDDRAVYIRYIQISDRRFTTPEESRIGDRWDQTVQKVDKNKILLTANDSCLRLPSGWHACIDLMSVNRRFDVEKRRLLPKKSAIIDFFYKDNDLLKRE